MTTTVLLWGDRWWIEGRTTPAIFGDLSRAAETLLAEFGDSRPSRVRLIYKPSSLVATSVVCPNGNRAILRAALGEEFPALTNDALAWGFEPIVGGRDRYATVLYREADPGLYPLVEALRTAGIEIEGVWPLPTLLNHVPDDWPDSGALTVLAIAAGQALVYCHTPEGTREVQGATGPETETLIGATISDALVRGTVALYVAALDEDGERLAARFASSDTSLRMVPWSRLALVTRSLSVRQPTQLLPPPALLHPNRVTATATVAALLATFALGALTARDMMQRRVASAEHDHERRKLQNAITRLQANEREIAQLRAEIVTLTPSRMACAELLRALTRNRPPQVVFTRLQADQEGFVVTGGVAGTGLTETAWRDWVTASLAASPLWKFAAVPPAPSADFSLKGRWP